MSKDKKNRDNMVKPLKDALNKLYAYDEAAGVETVDFIRTKMDSLTVDQTEESIESFYDCYITKQTELLEIREIYSRSALAYQLYKYVFDVHEKHFAQKPDLLTKFSKLLSFFVNKCTICELEETNLVLQGVIEPKSEKAPGYIDPIYKKWKEEWEKHHFYIMINKGEIVCDYYADMMIYGGSIDLGTKYYCNNVFMDLYKQKIYPEDAKSKELWFHRWMEDKTKRTYYQFDFLPTGAQVPDDVYNIWRGFKLDNAPVTLSPDEQASVVDSFNKFIMHLSSNDEKLFTFIVQYIADIIQNPGNKPGVVLVFVGPEGTGKGTLSLLLEQLLEGYFLETSDCEEVLGKFNSIISKKLVIILDEAVPINMYSKDGPLKNLVTAPKIVIKTKGSKSYIESSFCRMITSSNETNIMKISNSSRRPVVASPEILKDADYIYDVIENKEKIACLFHYLKNSVVVQYHNQREWQMNRPITEIYKELKANSLPNYIKFLYEFLTSAEEDIRIPNEDLYANYTTFCERDRKERMGYIDFGRKISKFKGIKNTEWRQGVGKKKRYGKILCPKDVIEDLVSQGYEYVNYNQVDCEKVDFIESDDE